MAAGSTFTVWAWLLLFGGGGGLPLPLSLPPLPEDPVMSAVAPEECLWYLTWSGCAKADPASKNQTEQLLAEEEVQRFGSELERRLVAALREHSQGPDAIAAQEVPKLVKMALTRPAAMFIADFKMGQRGPDIQGGLIVNLGEQSDAKNSLERLSALLPMPPNAAGKWQRMPSPPGAPVVEWGIDGKYLIVGIGDGSADGIAAREKGAAPKWLEAIRSRLKVERPAMIHYLNIKKIISLVQASGGLGRGAPPQLFDALGITNLNSLASMSGLEGNGWTSNMLLGMDGPPSGIFALTGGEPLTAADLASIPKDATFAVAARIDLDHVYRGISSIAGKVEPRARLELEQGIEVIENHLGIDLSRDIFKALGDTWCVYSAPSEGGLLITGLTIVAPIRDRERLVKAEERLRGMAKAAMGFPPGAGQPGQSFGPQSRVSISDFEFRGQQIHFLNFIGEPIPVAPAWCLTNKELIVSLSPQTIKAHLSRGAKASSLADVPAVASLLRGESAPTYVAYSDTATTVRTLYPLLQFGFEAIASTLQREGIQIDASIFPSTAAVLPHLEPSVSTSTMAKDGLFVTRHGTLPMEFESLPLLALPFGLYSVRSSEAVRRPAEARMAVPLQSFPLIGDAAARSQSSNNLKQISLAMHNFHSNYRSFPAAYSTSKDGKPLLSWRVQILPFIEEGPLYKEFHLDEPWDSEHNKALIPRMPKIFTAPGSKAANEFKTNYLVPRGENTIFPGAKKTRIQEITDGTSNTIMVVEASDDRAVIWTKPDDYEADAKQPMAGLVGLRQGGFLAAFADGSVHFVKETIKPGMLKALFTRSGGEPIDSSELY